MTALTKQIRFLSNNLAAGATITATSETANFPASNLVDPARSRVYRPAGNFEVTSANRTIYLNDGADKTATIATGSYTAAMLATAVAAALNAASTSWTCTYSTTTYKFTVGRSAGTKILRKSQTTNAAWDLLGYTGSVDEAASVADAPRVHTHERVVIDLGSAQTLTAAALIREIGEAMPFSAQAVVKLEANISDAWSSPPFSRTIVPGTGGHIEWLDDATPTYRYWSLYFQDKANAIAGPSGFYLGHLYLGNYDTFSATDVGTGFTMRKTDPSVMLTSQGGQRWFEVRTMSRAFSSLSIGVASPDDRAVLEGVFDRVGKTTPFYAFFDPTLALSRHAFDFGAYCYFDADPEYQHIVRDRFSITFALGEAI